MPHKPHIPFIVLLLLSVAFITVSHCLLPADGQARPAAAAVPAAALKPQPESFISAPCEIVEVYDGDTVTVRVSLDLRVRLLDCWAPEVRTTDAAEKVKGQAARDHLRKLAPVGSAAQILIPLTGHRLDDIITMGRVLAYLSVNGQDLSHQQVSAGHATKTK